jgi:hypothetical protein
VRRVEDEAGLARHPLGGGVEHVRGKVEDRPARAALGMQVSISPAHEVVGGRAVADVDVLDDAEVAERVEGPVDAGPVDARIDPGHPGDDLLGTEVAAGACEHGEDGLARTGHALATLAQEPTDLLDEGLHGLLSALDPIGHGAIVPTYTVRPCATARDGAQRRAGADPA